MSVIYSVSIFTSAFLLFLIQPMFARMVLPTLGGAPAVWNTALVFYQGALLGGYAYAHVSSTRLGVRAQSVLHLALMALATLALPIGVRHGSSPPVDANPGFWLLGILTMSVGLPFWVISASSPLLQKWFSSTKHRCASDPYFLYAAGNLGSMLALLAYPSIVEPRLHLEQQIRLWGIGYGLLTFIMFVCSLFIWSRDSGRTPSHCSEADVFDGLPPQSSPQSAPPPTLIRKLHWMALAFVPSSLMLSISTYLTTDIAAVPLLWIIPLAIYLLTFILTFVQRQWIPHMWMVKAMPILTLPLVIALATRGSDPICLVIPLHLTAFFAIAMFCHRELSLTRPPATDLTNFYLLLSVGGVLGGAFNALLAPLIFTNISEYPIALTLACLLLPWKSTVPVNPRKRIFDFALPLCIGLLTVALVLELQSLGTAVMPLQKALMFGIPILISFSFSRRPLRFGLSVGAIFLAATFYAGGQGQVLHAERSFFGVTRIILDNTGRYRQMMQGSTLHGGQQVDSARSREPIAYYARTGPLGQFFESFEPPDGVHNIAVVGLGVGCISCYAKSGQKWTYFEIDPAVERIAKDPRLFTYLRDCPADLRFILGDARRSLASVPDGSYDVLILDAYSSDSIPVHLLSLEALQLYLMKLKQQGVLVFHISNRYLDLEPVLGNLARESGLDCRVQSDFSMSSSEMDQGKTPATYVIMARNKSDLRAISSDRRWTEARTRDDLGVWTDSYASILRIVRWHP